MGFNQMFLILFIFFAALLIWGGWYTRKWINDASDFILAGREVSLLINVFGVAAIGFAGTSITLVPGLVVQGGFWASMWFSIAYLIGGLALYGLVFAKFIRRCGAHTLPEWLEMRFDSPTRTVITITTILGLLGILANNIVSMAAVVVGFTGWNLLITTTVIYFVFLLFTYIGGFWAVTLTDFMQMIIGLIALPLLLISLMVKYGGLSWPVANWPSPSGTIWDTGIAGWQIPVFSLKYPTVLTFFILFAAFLVWGNNYYWLRISSSRSERTATMSYVYAATLLLVVNYLILQFIGMYAGAAFKDTFAPFGKISPMAAYGVVLRAVPTFIAGFALLGALAASVSTAATAHMGATSTAVRDIYQRLFKPDAKASELVKPSKVIMMVLGVLVWLLTLYPGGPLYLFAFANAWLGPPSILVLLGAFWRRTTSTGALWGGLIGILFLMVITLLDLTKVWSINTLMHPGVAGLFSTLIVTVVISLLTKPKYYGSSSWQITPGVDELTKIEQGRLQLNSRDIDVLKLIKQGYNTMAEISDILEVDSSISNSIIEKLDSNRLIIREALVGAGFYTFKLTPLGEKYIPEMEDIGAQLAEENLSFEDIRILRAVFEGEESLKRYFAQSKINSLKFSAFVGKLIRQGLLKEGGLWKRKIWITEKGSSVLERYKSVASIA